MINKIAGSEGSPTLVVLLISVVDDSPTFRDLEQDFFAPSGRGLERALDLGNVVRWRL